MHLGTNGRGKWVTTANWSELNLGKWARTCVDKAFIQTPMAGDCDQFRSLWRCWLHFNRTYQLWKDTYQKHSKLIPFHLEFSGIFECFTPKLWGLEMYFTDFLHWEAEHQFNFRSSTVSNVGLTLQASTFASLPEGFLTSLEFSSPPSWLTSSARFQWQ